jgi:hypothetical protein
MKLQVSTLLMAWFGVLNCVQAEFFTSIGMWQQYSYLSEQPRVCHCMRSILILDEMSSSLGDSAACIVAIFPSEVLMTWMSYKPAFGLGPLSLGSAGCIWALWPF